MAKYVGAIDQGTTSTRFLLFDQQGQIAFSHQLEHKQIYPQPGWVEHDPDEIWFRTKEVIVMTMRKAGITSEDIASIGITNQRETTLAWNPKTGAPYGNALVWQDVRTEPLVKKARAAADEEAIRAKTGLPLATYFSATKIQWMMENRPGLKEAAQRGEAVFGTIDTFITWWLTGGPGKGVLVTDVTNASRTLLMDIHSLKWDQEMLDLFGVSEKMLARIVPSIPDEPYGYTDESGPLGARVPVAGILGDQQAALFGQACFKRGECKNTYGTGAFLLMNTGEEAVKSSKGLITTVAYQRGAGKPAYALEGSVAIAGSLVQWIRDNLGFIEKSSDIEKLALTVEDSGGVYFVPAFSGLFAPHWRPDARGVIAGLTGFVNSGHLARAVLEATAFQTREIFDAMAEDAGVELKDLKVDGGMTVNETLMQFQADLLSVPVIRPLITETTALGAAYAAGISAGFWKDREDVRHHWIEDTRWTPQMDREKRDKKYKFWKKAVQRTLDWQED